MASAMILRLSISSYSKYSKDVLGSIFSSTTPSFGQRISTSTNFGSLRSIHLDPCFSNACRKCRSPTVRTATSDSEAKAGFPDVGDENKQLGDDSLHVKSPSYTQWDALTSTIAGSSTLPFLLLQSPQIMLNAQNLLAGNRAALFAVGWLGQLTGLLGNLSLLSYFAKKKETGTVVVQTVGVISIYCVCFQLAMAGAMPSTPFIASSVAVGLGLILNFLNYYNLLNASIWRLWEDCITIGGLSVLPQVMWSTFVPYLPQSILPGVLSFAMALTTIILARSGKLSEKAVEFVGSTSGWTATLLFMWMPIAQMWTNYLNPNNIRGLSVDSILLAMIGNGLLIPRALFTRDIMWFTGSSWAALLYGWGNLLSIYIFGGIGKTYFLAVTSALILWLGTIFWRDAKAYGLNSPFSSLKQLMLGSM